VSRSTVVNLNIIGFFVGFYAHPIAFYTDNGFQIAPLGFDTIVTFMTVFKAFYVRRRNGGPSSRLIQTFLREGVFYYLLISIANLVCLSALVMLPSLIQVTTFHLVADRLTGSSTYSKIIFGL
jgi:hypothetical protein